MKQFPDDSRVRIRLSQSAVNAQLDALDQLASSRTAPNVRRTPRFAYRANEITVELRQRSGQWKQYACPTRNISAHGISLLFAHYVYTGTPVRVGLVSLQNHCTVQTGTVVSCRYLEGSAGIHEVGVKFDAPINVGLFHLGAVPTKLLLADDDASIRKLVPALLRHEHVNVVAVADGTSALQTLQADEFGLAMLDLDMPGMDGCALARELRNRGFALPLIAITAESEQVSHESLRAAGFDLWIPKPLTQISVVSGVQSLKTEPILSSLVHDPEMIELIDSFVTDLRARVRNLREALCGADTATLARQVSRLGVDAQTYGFDAIASVATTLAGRLRSADALDGIQSELRQLIRMCLSATGVACREVGPPPS